MHSIGNEIARLFEIKPSGSFWAGLTHKHTRARAFRFADEDQLDSARSGNLGAHWLLGSAAEEVQSQVLHTHLAGQSVPPPSSGPVILNCTWLHLHAPVAYILLQGHPTPPSGARLTGFFGVTDWFWAQTDG